MNAMQEHHAETLRIIAEAYEIPVRTVDLAEARYELMMARLDAIRDEPWPC